MFELVAENLHFSEGPRWHQNKLWFSDFYQHAVFSIDEQGILEKVVDIPNQPSGLGWMPDGSMLIVSMLDRKVMKFKEGQLSVHADLSQLTAFRCNDMVVDEIGNAYVGNFGSLYHAKNIKPTCLIFVNINGDAKIIERNLDFPNGTVITPDGKKMIIGETYGGRLTSFDINSDGSLTNRQIWAQMMPTSYYLITKIVRALKIPVKEGRATPYPVPDGICLDDHNGVWVASPTTSEVIRYTQGGEVTQRITTPDRAYACMLGGKTGTTLFISTAKTSDPEIASREKNGKIYSTEVEYPRAGKP